MTAALFVGAVLAVACVGLVALPFLREPRPQDDKLARRDELEQRRLALSEERDQRTADEHEACEPEQVHERLLQRLQVDAPSLFT